MQKKEKIRQLVENPIYTQFQSCNRKLYKLNDDYSISVFNFQYKTRQDLGFMSIMIEAKRLKKYVIHIIGQNLLL